MQPHSFACLGPADAARPNYMHHVMMYVGDDQIVESNYDVDAGILSNNGTR